jgi:hypothetical protein
VSDQDPEGGSRNWLREWLGPLVQAIALLSLLMYGLVRIFYDDFYSKFGLTPEDVGASSSVVISQTAAGVVFLFAFAIALGVVLVIPTLAILFGLVWMFRWGIWRFTVPTWFKWRRVLKATAAITLSVSLLVVVVAMRSGTHNASACALAGGNVFGLNFLSLPSSILKLHAQRVDVTWLSGQELVTGRRLMFLGEASGTSFLYDVDNETTHRYPSSSAAMAFRDTRDVPCSR